MKITDDEIIELYFARDERALTETDRKYGGLLFSVAFGILRDKCDCEECKNDALLSVWNSIPPERPESLRAYLLRIIRNKSLNMYEKRRSQKRIPSELVISTDELSAALESGEYSGRFDDAAQLGALLESFARALCERSRYIFIERYYIGTSISDIARELGISKWSVYKEIDKIREQLRSYLTENEVYL